MILVYSISINQHCDCICNKFRRKTFYRRPNESNPLTLIVGCSSIIWFESFEKERERQRKGWKQNKQLRLFMPRVVSLTWQNCPYHHSTDILNAIMEIPPGKFKNKLEYFRNSLEHYLIWTQFLSLCFKCSQSCYQPNISIHFIESQYIFSTSWKYFIWLYLQKCNAIKKYIFYFDFGY